MKSIHNNNFGFNILYILLIGVALLSCSKKKAEAPKIYKDGVLTYTVNNLFNTAHTYKAIGVIPTIEISFSEAITENAGAKIVWKKVSGNSVNVSAVFSNENKTLVLTPSVDLEPFSSYQIIIPDQLETEKGGKILNSPTINLQTGFDNEDKFPRISDEELLTLIQEQTFKYFWDFAHPNSGLARERNTSDDVVTTGGSGFGIMSIVVGINRGFITKNQGLARLQKIVAFLKTADTFHGAFPHWINGNTGKVQPFSAKDNGADLVETSFLMQGLLVARQFFNSTDAGETQLRADINQLYNDVEWDWFRKGGGDKLY